MREPMHLSMSSRGKIWEAIQDAKDQNAHVSLGPDQILVNGRNQNYIACVPFLLLSYTPKQHEISMVLEMSSNHENGMEI